MSQDNFLKELGRSYIVSAFFPSAFFVSIGILLFRGFIPRSIMEQIPSTLLSEWGGEWIVSIVLMLWVAFFLYSASDVTVKLFEGYIMPKFLRNLFKEVLRSRWFNSASREHDEFKKIDQQLQWLQERGRQPSVKFMKQHYEQYLKARQEIQQHEISGPFKFDSVLPTRLGNVLRASEIYANDRYLIEELTVWPRLVPLMPQEFLKALEEQNNHMMFLLNSALLSFLNGFFALGVSVLGFSCELFQNNYYCLSIRSYVGFFYIGYNFISPMGFFGVGIVLIIFGYMLYSISVNVAEGLGLYIRTAYDLYREDLLRQLNWELPLTLDEEKDLWEKICLFYSTGNKLTTVTFPSYRYYDKDGTEIKKTPKTGNSSQYGG